MSLVNTAKGVDSQVEDIGLHESQRNNRPEQNPQSRVIQSMT